MEMNSRSIRGCWIKPPEITDTHADGRIKKERRHDQSKMYLEDWRGNQRTKDLVNSFFQKKQFKNSISDKKKCQNGGPIIWNAIYHHFFYLKCYLIAFNPQNGGWSTSIYIRIMTGLPLLNKYRSQTVCRFSCKFRPSLFFIFCSKSSLYVSPHCCRGCLILENY